MSTGHGKSPRIDRGRRAFLLGRPARKTPVRPPWSTEATVLDRCTRCGACVAACPEHIILEGGGSYPEIDFHRGQCTFCRSCVTACESGVFELAESAPWPLVAQVSEACLTRQGVFCRTCGDTCPEDAIALAPAVGRVPMPRIDAARCTGCGACVAPCPADAIAIRPPPSDAPVHDG